MKTSLSFILLLSLFGFTQRLHAGPQPYAWEIIYRAASAGGRKSAADIRKHPALVTKIDVPDFRGFLDEIGWKNSKCDSAIKRKAGPLVMIVDCYDRGQPEPPRPPQFETLYISKTYLYSDEDCFLKISPRIRRVLDSTLVPE